MFTGRDQDCAELFVGEEFDGGVREYAEEGHGVAFVQAFGAFSAIDVSNRMGKPRPAACVFGELGIRGLEKDLYAVEWCDDRFGLGDFCQYGHPMGFCGAHSPHSQPARQRYHF